MMLDFLAPLFRRRVVFLLDDDGKVTKRWAKKTPFGLTCNRYVFPGIGPCLLLPDGSVQGPIYVARWAEANIPAPPEEVSDEE